MVGVEELVHGRVEHICKPRTSCHLSLRWPSLPPPAPGFAQTGQLVPLDKG